MTAQIALSYLYVPGDSGTRLDLAHTRGADAVIADLEDSVAVASKPSARSAVAEWLEQPTPEGSDRWVRINAGSDGLDDLEHVFGAGLRGVCLPKVSGPDDVEQVATMLSRLEMASHRSGQRVSIMPLIETAQGLAALADTAAAARVCQLQLGEIDLAADLWLDPGPDEAELLAARSAVVAASVVAGLLPPLGAVSPDVHDLEAFQRTTLRLRRLGFLGRAAVHPLQLAPIHEVFVPDVDSVREAQRLIDSYDAVTASGRGVSLDDHGRMIDEAVVRRSRRVVALARRGMEERC